MVTEINFQIPVSVCVSERMSARNISSSPVMASTVPKRRREAPSRFF